MPWSEIWLVEEVAGQAGQSSLGPIASTIRTIAAYHTQEEAVNHCNKARITAPAHIRYRVHNTALHTQEGRPSEADPRQYMVVWMQEGETEYQMVYEPGLQGVVDRLIREGVDTASIAVYKKQADEELVDRYRSVAVTRLRHYADRIEAGELKVNSISENIAHEPTLGWNEVLGYKATDWKITVSGPLDAKLQFVPKEKA